MKLKTLIKRKYMVHILNVKSEMEKLVQMKQKLEIEIVRITGVQKFLKELLDNNVYDVFLNEKDHITTKFQSVENEDI